jgi:ubiquinone/menaquinone biosynthesis C-methylase UbiE
MDQENVWDGVAEEWAKFRTRPVEEVKEFLDGKKGKILDLGCGSGRNFVESDDLAPKGVPSAQTASADADKVGKFYGVDFSGKLLEIAEGKGYVELKKGVTYAIPYGDGFFDWVVFVRVLHCVDSAEKRKKTLEEVYRVLKRGGEAVISTIGRGNQRVKNKPKEGVIPWTVGDVKYERYNYVYDKDEFEDLLKSVGFEIVSLEEGKNIVAVVRKV